VATAKAAKLVYWWRTGTYQGGHVRLGHESIFVVLFRYSREDRVSLRYSTVKLQPQLLFNPAHNTVHNICSHWWSTHFLQAEVSILKHDTRNAPARLEKILRRVSPAVYVFVASTNFRSESSPDIHITRMRQNHKLSAEWTAFSFVTIVTGALNFTSERNASQHSSTTF